MRPLSTLFAALIIVALPRAISASGQAADPASSAAPVQVAVEAAESGETKAEASVEPAGGDEDKTKAAHGGFVESSLPPEVVAKLSGEQLLELLEMREERRNPQLGNVEVLVPTGLFILVGFIVGFPLYFRNRQFRQRQETLRLMVEKGADIPPELLTPPVPKRSDLRRGVILLATGLGVTLFLAIVHGGETHQAWSLGLIPTLIGAGYLLVHKLEANGKNKNNDNKNSFTV